MDTINNDNKKCLQEGYTTCPLNYYPLYNNSAFYNFSIENGYNNTEKYEYRDSEYRQGGYYIPRRRHIHPYLVYPYPYPYAYPHPYFYSEFPHIVIDPACYNHCIGMGGSNYDCSQGCKIIILE